MLIHRFYYNVFCPLAIKVFHNKLIHIFCIITFLEMKKDLYIYFIDPEYLFLRTELNIFCNNYLRRGYMFLYFYNLPFVNSKFRTSVHKTLESYFYPHSPKSSNQNTVYIGYSFLTGIQKTIRSGLLDQNTPI